MIQLTQEHTDLYERLVNAEVWADGRYIGHDLGNARLFADFFAHRARYVLERKCWYVYDGRVWRPDPARVAIMQLCKMMTDVLPSVGLRIKDYFIREGFMNRASEWNRLLVRERIVKDAQDEKPISLDAFDADPMLFNCLNCTVDLRTFTSHPHTPDDLLTMISGVEYQPGAECERWEQFVDEVMQPAPRLAPVQTTIADDADDPFRDQPSPLVQKRTYLQMALGYALTGLTNHECMFILHGATTRNGKGTMMETILRMMGDYGKTAMPETIGTRLNVSSSAPREDVARLRGARFVNISEPDKKLTLSAALVKQMTGGDTLTARFLHENSFEFKPQFKMFVNTNYLPQITDMTLFSSGRIKTIPFERHFEPDEQDRTLKDFFARPENLSGIFNWCLLGLNCMDVMGFDEPPVIRAATDGYRRDSDKVAQFVDDMLVEDGKSEIKTADLYRMYTAWCEENGYMCENMKNFKLEISKHGTIVKKRPAGMGRSGTPTHILLGFRAA